jgi:hypothetical protein
MSQEQLPGILVVPASGISTGEKSEAQATRGQIPLRLRTEAQTFSEIAIALYWIIQFDLIGTDTIFTSQVK